MAVLHDAHAGIGEVDELFLCSLESGERERRGARVEVDGSRHGALA
jgi:hypothetical protein